MRNVIVKSVIFSLLLIIVSLPLRAGNIRLTQDDVDSIVNQNKMPKVIVLKPKSNEERYHDRIKYFNNGMFYWAKDGFDAFAKSNYKESQFYAEQCKMNLIHQIGLNISKFMDLETFNALMKDRSDKRDIQKNTLVNEAVNYFTEKGIKDPREICKVSKAYFLNQAEKAFENKEYQLAYTYYTTALEGETSNSKLNEIRDKIKSSDKCLEKGSVVIFGKYEQDGNVENGPEPIEWIVLNNVNNRLVLLSKFVLTHKPVHSVEKRFEWPDSELCSWLNNEFYNTSFDENEKKQMHKVGNNVFFLDNYLGDYVVIPCFKDLEDLDYYWLKTYAVPSDVKAKELIDFDGKPFILPRDNDGKISEKDVMYYRFGCREDQPKVLTSAIDNISDTDKVYCPTGYWVNHPAGNMEKRGSDFNRFYYRYFDENGFINSAAAKLYNGVRPVICIDCSKQD